MAKKFIVIGETVGDRILSLRAQTGETQTEFAAAVGVSSGAVSQWETNYSRPTRMRLIRIAIHFGVSVDDLIANIPERARASKATG